MNGATVMVVASNRTAIAVKTCVPKRLRTRRRSRAQADSMARKLANAVTLPKVLGASRIEIRYRHDEFKLTAVFDG